jgi:hypothetical protein
MPEILIENPLNSRFTVESSAQTLQKRSLLYHSGLMTISNATQRSRRMLNTIWSDIATCAIPE